MLGKMFLTNLILDQYERSNKWKGNSEGKASFRIKEEYINRVADKSALLQEAKELERLKLLKIKWVKGYFNYDIEKVIYPLTSIERFYEITGRTPKHVIVSEQQKLTIELFDSLKTSWIKDYINEEFLSKLKKAPIVKEPDEINRLKLLYKCLTALDGLNTPVFKRIFSKRYLNNSKIFEKELQETIIRKARKYNVSIDDGMEDSQVLEQLYIEEYSQELHLKGSLLLDVDGVVIDTGSYHFGTVLNIQTLKHSKILEKQNICKIITIENKANFVAEPYEEGTLILFCHGFFTPLERVFLSKLEGILKINNITYLHSGDLDYGGVRIFQYIKNRIFPELEPYKMDVETFDTYLSFGEELGEGIINKLRKCEEPLLTDVINRMINTKYSIEQEAFL